MSLNYEKAIRGALCNIGRGKFCTKIAEYWSAFSNIYEFDQVAKMHVNVGVQYRCEEHCNPDKWFLLTEEDYL